MPCILLAKKRYVGFKYESESQVEPIFEAKGIETIRRDTCQLVSKVLETTLKFFSNSLFLRVKTNISLLFLKKIESYFEVMIFQKLNLIFKHNG